MKTVFVDTNVCIDLLGNRKLFYDDAAKIFSLADEGTISLGISALSFSTIDYILKSSSKGNYSRKVLVKFKTLVNVLAVDDKIIELALASSFRDFEDAVQHHTAVENKCSLILTRNITDFKSSLIPVLTPASFLKSFH